MAVGEKFQHHYCSAEESWRNCLGQVNVICNSCFNYNTVLSRLGFTGESGWQRVIVEERRTVEGEGQTHQLNTCLPNKREA